MNLWAYYVAQQFVELTDRTEFVLINEEIEMERGKRKLCVMFDLMFVKSRFGLPHFFLWIDSNLAAASLISGFARL